MRLRNRALAVISVSLFLVGGLLPAVAVAEDTGPWSIGIYEFPKCLEVEGGSTANSAQVQLWQLLDSGVSGYNGEFYTLHNRNSRLCLNAQGASTANGTDLIQYTCSADWNNFFTWWPAR